MVLTVNNWIGFSERIEVAQPESDFHCQSGNHQYAYEICPDCGMEICMNCSGNTEYLTCQYCGEAFPFD